MTRLVFLVIGLVFILGCSVKETTRFTQENQSDNVSQEINDSTADKVDSNSNISNGNNGYYSDQNGYDPVLIQSLESARQHYMDALKAEMESDSIKCAAEFEYTINILNELSYYPGIERNQDFNELSKSIIEDYENYIAIIDSLGDQTSIFALREKLNQILESEENPEYYTTRDVLTGFAVPLVINGFVQLNIDYFVGKGRHHMERWLKRSGKYFPIMKRIFSEEGVPEELIYLSMIESGLNPTARSWAKAVGIWQFIKGTGKLYGLDGNWWYDDRRDVEKATRAAAQHLRDLFYEFKDWHLAIASYNSGAGRVKSAVRRSGTNVFWFLRKYLPLETRNYVPQYIAAAVIAMNPPKYGFFVDRDSPLEYDVVTIDECVDLSILAECANTEIGIIRDLNPELLQMFTPPGYKGFKLKIPVGSSELFSEKYSQVPNDKKRNWGIHLVKKGESISIIAKKYGIARSVLAEANNISLNKKLSVGSTLVIPGSSKSLLAASQNATALDNINEKPKKKIRSKYVEKDKIKISYKVKKGDTLSEIAKMYNIRVSDIRIWNDISYGKHIIAGNTIDLYIEKEKTASFADADDSTEKSTSTKSITKKSTSTKKNKKSYWIVHKVQQGETLGKIASRYGVNIQDIKNWNGIKKDKIFSGQELEIYLIPDVPSATDIKSETVTKSESDIKYIMYKVKKGDTLYAIAAQYNVSIDKLKQWNKITTNKIQIGQVIKIYTSDEV